MIKIRYLNENVDLKTQREAFKDIRRAKSKHKRKFFIKLKEKDYMTFRRAKRIDLDDKINRINFTYTNSIFLYGEKKYLAIEHSDGEHYIIYQQKIVVPKSRFVETLSPEHIEQVLLETEF